MDERGMWVRRPVVPVYSGWMVGWRMRRTVLLIPSAPMRRSAVWVDVVGGLEVDMSKDTPGLVGDGGWMVVRRLSYSMLTFFLDPSIFSMVSNNKLRQRRWFEYPYRSSKAVGVFLVVTSFRSLKQRYVEM